MEAVIVVGGFGTRMAPLTSGRPKHLLPVAGVPLVVHQLAKLAAAGVRRVVLATSYHADQFEPLLGDGSAWGVELVFVREDVPLGTGGAIRNASRHLHSSVDEPVVVLNGDILSSHDLRAQVRRHLRAAADVTLHLVTVPDARQFGCVPTDSDGSVLGFFEKSARPVSSQINAGCYVFQRSVVDEIPEQVVMSIERESFPTWVAQGRHVMGYVEDAYWRDIGTPAALCQASADLVTGRAVSPAYRHEPAESWVSPDASVAADAVLAGGSAIGPRAVVDSRARIEASVLCVGVRVGADSHVVGSVLGEAAIISAGCVVTNAAIADGAQVEHVS